MRLKPRTPVADSRQFLMDRVWAVVAAGVVAAVVWHACHLSPPAEETRRCCSGSGLCWQMTESRADGKVGYSFRSESGQSAWDKRFGNKRVCWLYILRTSSDALVLQMQNGALFELNLADGSFRELPETQTPLPEASLFFNSL